MDNAIFAHFCFGNIIQTSFTEDPAEIHFRHLQPTLFVGFNNLPWYTQDTFYPRILAAAITACPNERPPSFVGTSLCRYTLKPSLFKSDKVRPNKVIFCQTPPDKTTSFTAVSDLI